MEKRLQRALNKHTHHIKEVWAIACFIIQSIVNKLELSLLYNSIQGVSVQTVEAKTVFDFTENYPQISYQIPLEVYFNRSTM